MIHFPINSDSAYFYGFLAIVFVAINAFFVMAEFALVKIRVTRLEILVNKGNPVAKLARRMVENLDPYLSATQLGITLASLGLGWVGEPAFAWIIDPILKSLDFSISPAALHSISLSVAFISISAIHIILGELVPKSIAIRTAETACLFIAVPLHIFYVIFFPFLWVLNGVSNLILKIFRIKPTGGPNRAHSEEEIKLIVEDSFEEGVIGPRKRFLLDKAIEFSHKTLRDIMVAEPNMACFYLNESVHDNLEQAKEAGHSRFPLRTDRKGAVLGFIHMKDVIWALENNEVINLFDLRRPILFFDADVKLDNALREFQKKSIHIGIVISPAKEILGLVTLENVIEQLVGAIEDEFDVEMA